MAQFCEVTSPKSEQSEPAGVQHVGRPAHGTEETVIAQSYSAHREVFTLQ